MILYTAKSIEHLLTSCSFFAAQWRAESLYLMSNNVSWDSNGRESCHLTSTKVLSRTANAHTTKTKDRRTRGKVRPIWSWFYVGRLSHVLINKFWEVPFIETDRQRNCNWKMFESWLESRSYFSLFCAGASSLTSFSKHS